MTSLKDVYGPNIDWSKGVTTTKDEVVILPLMFLSATHRLVAGSAPRNSAGALRKAQCCVSWNQILPSLKTKEGVIRLSYNDISVPT